MSEKTDIAWTDSTWNPIRARHRETGKVGWICVHKSAGCGNCYSETMNRWRGNDAPFTPSGLKQIALFLDEQALALPVRWRTQRRIFVCSMTDLFADFVPEQWINQIFAVMALADEHVFQILTKRPERMLRYLSAIDPQRNQIHRWLREWRIGDGLGGRIINGSVQSTRLANGGWPLWNVWPGVSVENQATADERIPLLRQTPAALRWVSYEPALGYVDFTRWLPEVLEAGGVRRRDIASITGTVQGETSSGAPETGVGQPSFLDWLVIGGESGPSARPFDLEWARSAIRQCRQAGVPVFCKQIGSNGFIVEPDRGATGADERARRRRWETTDRKGADPEEWPKDLVVREFPK